MAQQVVSARLEGVSEALMALKSLEYKAKRRVVTAAVRAGLKVARREARMRVPVISGVLKKSIRTSVRLNRKTGTVMGKVEVGKSTKAMKKKGMSAYYAHMVHGGTKPHKITVYRGAMNTPTGIYDRVDHPGSRANPFMEEAGNAAFHEAVREFQKTFRAKLEQEARRA